MTMSNLKKNLGFNFILTTCNYIFPIIVYPYVSRVLGVENIGICNFVDSIINYFVLFSMLGVSTYGIREIARCRDDLKKRDEVFSNLFVLNAIMTIISLLALIICTLFIPKIIPYSEFLGVGILKVVFNLFLVEWFFQGIQDFKYITIRSVIVRCLYVVLIFLFVREKGDAIIYYLLTCILVYLKITKKL